MDMDEQSALVRLRRIVSIEFAMKHCFKTLFSDALLQSLGFAGDLSLTVCMRLVDTAEI